MQDITFDVNLNWTGIGKEGSREITIGERTFEYSAPKEMREKGVL